MLVFKVFLFLYIGNLWKKTYPIVKEIQRFHSWSMIITIIQLFQSVGSIFLSSSTDLERKTKTEYLKKWRFYSHPKLSLYKENKNLDVAYKQQANITKTFSKIITERLWQESCTPEISLSELPQQITSWKTSSGELLPGLKCFIGGWRKWNLCFLDK